MRELRKPASPITDANRVTQPCIFLNGDTNSAKGSLWARRNRPRALRIKRKALFISVWPEASAQAVQSKDKPTLPKQRLSQMGVDGTLRRVKQKPNIPLY